MASCFYPCKASIWALIDFYYAAILDIIYCHPDHAHTTKYFYIWLFVEALITFVFLCGICFFVSVMPLYMHLGYLSIYF